MNVSWDSRGKYTTTLLTEEAVKKVHEHNASEPLFLYLSHLATHSANPYIPLQAPDEVILKFNYIEDKDRRIFAGMFLIFLCRRRGSCVFDKSAYYLNSNARVVG
jgi:arylsulfatase B